MTPITTDVEEIDLRDYTAAELVDIADRRPTLRLSPVVAKAIDAGGDYVMTVATRDRYTYGINTGFGSLCETRIPDDQLSELQHRQLLSHACGVGEVVSERLCRLTMLVKLLTFRTGRSGISLTLVHRFLDLWNAGVIPAIPKRGTVGASGDLAPLAHMSLPLIGHGRVYVDGTVREAGPVLAERGLTVSTLQPKEGLALTNGVQYIDALGLESLARCSELVRLADVIAALSMQGFSCASTYYRPLLHTETRHQARRVVAENLTRLLAGSNHDQLPHRNIAGEDPYSFRCVPQVHAAIRQTISHSTQIVEDDSNSVSDNPLFFAEHDEVLIGGNLHGESTAFALDFAAIAMSELANISERRTYQLLSGQHGLPDFLVARPGLDSGLMVVQYTAAALVNENKVLSTPASIDSIPTCQLQEDHVSMGGTSAYKLQQVIDNCEYVLAIELLAAAQAVDLNEGLRLSAHGLRLHGAFREVVAFLEHDRQQSLDIERAHEFVQTRRREHIVGVD